MANKNKEAAQGSRLAEYEAKLGLAAEMLGALAASLGEILAALGLEPVRLAGNPQAARALAALVSSLGRCHADVDLAELWAKRATEAVEQLRATTGEVPPMLPHVPDPAPIDPLLVDFLYHSGRYAGALPERQVRRMYSLADGYGHFGEDDSDLPVWDWSHIRDSGADTQRGLVAILMTYLRSNGWGKDDEGQWVKLGKGAV